MEENDDALQEYYLEELQKMRDNLSDQINKLRKGETTPKEAHAVLEECCKTFSNLKSMMEK
jgi:hypothetical protein